MKRGITELGWVIILIITLGVILFIIVLAFTTNFISELQDFFKGWKLEEMIEAWKRVITGQKE